MAQLSDRRPGAEARPRPDARRGRSQVVAARRDPVGRIDTGVPSKLLGRFLERCLANIVAAHDELTRLWQRKALKDRKFGY
jgi:hypothetical protein